MNIKWENRTQDDCEEKNLPHVSVNEISKNRKYKWDVQLDFVFVEDHKLKKEALGEIEEVIEENNIEYRMEKTAVSLGSNPKNFESIEFEEKEDAKKVAKKLVDLAEQEDNWIHRSFL